MPGTELIVGSTATIKTLSRLEKQIDSARTDKAIKQAIRKAESIKILFREVNAIRQRAEWVIACAKLRIATEIHKTPKATRPARWDDRKSNGTEILAGRASTGVDKDERSKLLRFYEHTRDKPGLRRWMEPIWAEGEEATVTSILREINHSTHAERRASREQKLGRWIRTLPDKKYGVMLADPPWKFKTRSAKGLTSRSADDHYPVSELEKIKQAADANGRKVADLAAPNCVLFLWATVPMWPQALEVMAAWGFEYKSAAFWKKDRPGTGYWFRNIVEILMVGTVGHPVPPAAGEQPDQWFEAPKGAHSEKPDHAYEMIEALYPTTPKIELYGRALREGWDIWGFEAPQAEAAE